MDQKYRKPQLEQQNLLHGLTSHFRISREFVYWKQFDTAGHNVDSHSTVRNRANTRGLHSKLRSCFGIAEPPKIPKIVLGQVGSSHTEAVASANALLPYVAGGAIREFLVMIWWYEDKTQIARKFIEQVMIGG